MRVYARLEKEGGEDGALAAGGGASVIFEDERTAGGLVVKNLTGEVAFTERGFQSGANAGDAVGDAECVKFATNEFLTGFDIYERERMTRNRLPDVEMWGLLDRPWLRKSLGCKAITQGIGCGWGRGSPAGGCRAWQHRQGNQSGEGGEQTASGGFHGGEILVNILRVNRKIRVIRKRMTIRESGGRNWFGKVK